MTTNSTPKRDTKVCRGCLKWFPAANIRKNPNGYQLCPPCFVRHEAIDAKRKHNVPSKGRQPAKLASLL